MTKRADIRRSTRFFRLLLMFLGTPFVAKGTTFARLSISQLFTNSRCHRSRAVRSEYGG